ncbi:hypothetical protein HDU77_000484 [Chytriomyces hyalinus]|nr:hypothetical protein HDU77_000484 [Chytriomyces hyalinus]
MIDNYIPAFKTPNGNVLVYEQKLTMPINKDDIIETLSTKLGVLLAKELAALLVESRQSFLFLKLKTQAHPRVSASFIFFFGCSLITKMNDPLAIVDNPREFVDL